MSDSKQILRAHKERIDAVVIGKTGVTQKNVRRLLPRVNEDYREQKDEEEEKNVSMVGKIIAADDHNINIEVLKNDFAELNLSHKVFFLSNG